MFERYGLFGAVCAGYAFFVFWLLLHRRLTLQSSLLYLSLLFALGISSLLLPQSGRLIAMLGFALPSNFIFAVSIGALSLLHLGALVTLSRVETRSITLVQELALLEEKLERIAHEAHVPVPDANVESADSTEPTHVSPAPVAGDRRARDPGDTPS